MLMRLLNRPPFLSTPSGWRATIVPVRRLVCAMISIHALRVEGDQFIKVNCFLMFDFYPRPPGGGRHRLEHLPSFYQNISIHALRVEGDVKACSHVCDGEGFLSTPSGWRATICRAVSFRVKRFLSTPSGWRATRSNVRKIRLYGISIHALRVEGDPSLTRTPANM